MRTDPLRTVAEVALRTADVAQRTADVALRSLDVALRPVDVARWPADVVSENAETQMGPDEALPMAEVAQTGGRTTLTQH